MGRRARSLRLVGGLVQLLLHGLDLLGEVVVGLLDLRRQLGVGLVDVRGDLLRQLLALGDAGADGGLQAVAQLAGLLLHLGVRLAQVGGGLLDVGARRLQRLLRLAVGVVDLQERGSVTCRRVRLAWVARSRDVPGEFLNMLSNRRFGFG